MISLFELHLAEIEAAIAAKRGFWKLSALSYLDYNDVSQQIRIHIAKKLSQNKWDQSRPFPQWVGRVVTNQIKNIIRNNYGKVAPPCYKCPFNNGGNFCAYTKSGIKDSSCVQYSKWLRGKRAAYGLKLTCPIEDFDGASHYTDFDVEKTAENFHALMKEKLTPRMWEAYQYLYIDKLTDLQIIKKMGFTGTKVKGKVYGLRQLNNIKNQIMELAKKLVTQIDMNY